MNYYWSIKAQTTFLLVLVTGFATADLAALENSTQLEEVLVTATKRVESAQDISQSIEVISRETIEALAIVDFAELSNMVPNFFVADGIVSTNVNMRGMGSGGDFSFEQSVGMFIDGIYMPRSRQYRTPFFDAERVEILRGPQAVLFGLNTTAGAVSVMSAKSRPGEAFSGSATVEYETEYQGTTISVVAGGSVTDSLALRLALQYLDSDGYFENIFTGQTEGDRKGKLARITGVWEPTDKLSITAKYENTEYDLEGSIGELFGPGGLLDGDGKLNWKRGVNPSLLGTFPTNDVAAGHFQNTENIMVSFDYDVGKHLLTLLYGLSDMDYQAGTDLDAFAGSFLNPFSGDSLVDASISPLIYKQSSYELKLTSPGDQTFDYIAGLYYQSAEFFQDNQVVAGYQAFMDSFLFPDACEAFGLCDFAEFISSKYWMDQDLWSAYIATTWNVSPDFRVIAGARYVHDEKEVMRNGRCDIYDPISRQVIVPGGGFLGCPSFMDGIEDDRSSGNLMPELSVQWDVSDTIMLYGKVSSSAKSGGFAAASNLVESTFEYDDEKVKAVEVGMKSMLADGAAELNISLFRSQYDDLQVNSFVNVNNIATATVQNAAESINQGVEASGRYAAADWLILGGSVAYLDAYYKKYTTSPCAPSLGLPQGSICDLSGRPMPYAPEWSATVFADIKQPLNSAISLAANLTLAYSDSYFTDGTLDIVGLQNSYTRVYARIGIEAGDGRWSLSVIGKNLTQEKVLDVSQHIFAYVGYIAPPRTITLQGIYRFGGR